MHFVVKGILAGDHQVVRWEDGEITANARVFETLDRRAKLLEEDKIAPIAIDAGLSVPSHMADPMKLLFLLIHKTVFPPILRNGEIVEIDIPQATIPDGAIG